MYVDLNVPWNEVTRANDHERLKTLLATYDALGYDAVALNHTVHGQMPKTPCPIPVLRANPKATHNTPSNRSKGEMCENGSLDYQSAFQRHPLLGLNLSGRKAQRKDPLHLYTRLTLVLEDPRQNYGIVYIKFIKTIFPIIF